MVMMTRALFVVVFVWMQYARTAGQFEGDDLGDNLGGLGVGPTEPVTPPDEQLSSNDFLGDPQKRILSAEALANMGQSEYNDIIAQVIETNKGSLTFKVDDQFKPDRFLVADKHLTDAFNESSLESGNLGAANGEELGSRVKRASFSEKYSDTWTNGVIPYDADNMTDVKYIAWIDAAVDMFNKKTCVQWLPYTNQAHYAKFLGVEKQICAAYVGMRSVEISPIYLYEIGSLCRAYYVVLHEMLHVMGANHEQSRQDRYNNIDIDWNCIKKGARQNYMLSQSADEDSEYDFGSLMQYSPNLFRECITDGLYENKTMRAKDPRLDFLLYEVVNQLTHYDIKAVTDAYTCNEGCNDDCEYGGFVTKTVENPTCHCVCPKYLSGDRCTVRENANVCGSHTILETQQSKIVKSNGYDNGFYDLSEECIYLFTSPPGTRIKLEFVDMQITVSDAEIATCIHYVEVRAHLMGQNGPEECGVTTNLTYFTSINSESHLALLSLNTIRSGNPAKGFMLKATAFVSECLNDPCKNGGTCTDVESADGSYHFQCACIPGYSGDDCTYVATDATVTCDAENGVNIGICCMEDTKEGTMRFYEYRSTTPTYTYAYLYVASQLPDVGGDATLISSVTFQPAYRCLSFYVGIRTASYNGLITNIEVSYTSQTQTVPVVVYATSDTSSKWRLQKATLPPEDDVKIKMTVTKPASGGIIALNNIEVAPGACYACESSPCLNGGTCSQSAYNDQEFECLCPLGYSGLLCETYVCDSLPCLNGGECSATSENSDGYECDCMLGYLGHTCDVYVCDPSPCQNQGTCDVTDTTPSQYLCSCILGYYGSHCEYNICEPNPCQRGGSCSPFEDTFQCACLYGTGGKDCSVDLTPVCSFETSDECDFQNSDQGSCNWAKLQGPPETLYTGPRRAYSGQTYLYVDSSNNKGKMCRFELKKQFNNADRCFVVFYVMSGAYVDTLRVNMDVNGKSTNLWTASGNKGNRWKHQLIDISTSSSSYTAVQVEATTKRVVMGDIAIDNIQLKPYPCSKIVLCTFEEGLPSTPTKSCVKLNPDVVQYKSNWRVRQRPSQQQFRSTNYVWTTGPESARSGYRYAFIDSSYDVNAAMEVVHSFTGPACFSIGYHMYGNNIGRLYVKLADENGTNEEVVWSIDGPQGNQWHSSEFDISSLTNKKIIITADKGNKTPDDDGDIAIDDIMVVNQPCAAT